MTKKIGISLPDDIHERAERNAREQQIPLSTFIQQALSGEPLASMSPSIRGRVESHAKELGISVDEFVEWALAAFLCNFAAHIQARGTAPAVMQLFRNEPVNEKTMALLTAALVSEMWHGDPNS